MRPPPALVTLCGLGLLLATFYPLLAEAALERWGVRALASVLLFVGVASLLGLRRVASAVNVSWGQRAALLALPATAAATADALFLRAVPAAIQFAIALAFALSLRGGSSILQQTARRIHPYAPDFIGPYCRKSTAVFAAIFAAQGVALAWIAWQAPPGWAFTSGWLAWAPVVAASLVEWAVRKSWFRYYGDGPLDRRLRKWFPPENTEVGRRSLDYVRRMRAELGMPPP